MNEAEFDRKIGHLAEAIRLDRTPCPAPESLVAYVCNSLSAAEASMIARHAAACGDCTLEIDRLQGYSAILRTPSSRRRGFAMFAAGAMAAGLAGLVGIYIGRATGGAAGPSLDSDLPVSAPVFHLSPITRDGREQPPVVTGESSALVLTIPVAAGRSYRAVIRDASGHEVMTDFALNPGAAGDVSIAVKAGKLPSGAYIVDVTERDESGHATGRRFQYPFVR